MPPLPAPNKGNPVRTAPSSLLPHYFLTTSSLLPRCYQCSQALSLRSPLRIPVKARAGSLRRPSPAALSALSRKPASEPLCLSVNIALAVLPVFVVWRRTPPRPSTTGKLVSPLSTSTLLCFHSAVALLYRCSHASLTFPRLWCPLRRVRRRWSPLS